jgi:hypothetical protein|tara:strand:+ start:33 stop:248 length:216 start_codon:yes stop_codon:yes gene_type:complete
MEEKTMKEKMKNAINVLEDLEFDKEFRMLIDNHIEFEKLDNNMVMIVETLKKVMQHKYGVSSIYESGGNND